jgi:glycosyltransferase involved in cell wall biosynthesis
MTDPNSPDSLDRGAPESLRVALFTDTLGDVNGVSRFIRTIASYALRRGASFHVFTSTNIPCPNEPNLHNFPARFATTMPGYSHLEVALPPGNLFKRALREYAPHVVHVSTPGPVGVCGARLARRMRIPLVGTYHTDFPAFVDDLLTDPVLTRVCRETMSRFYRPFARVLTRSVAYKSRVEALGIDPARIEALTPGCDHASFDRRFADASVWREHGVSDHEVKIISCGRVSVEKNLPLLTRAWRDADAALRARAVPARLIVVGDGPYLNEMRRELNGTRSTFLGYRFGRELATLYASSDLLVFPSLTDTLGQVVLEAQCSALPAIVSDVGGPKEVIAPGTSGLVVPGNSPGLWAQAIITLACDAKRRAAMRDAAYARSRGTDFEHSFLHFWRIHDEVRRSMTARHPVAPT